MSEELQHATQKLLGSVGDAWNVGLCRTHEHHSLGSGCQFGRIEDAGGSLPLTLLVDRKCLHITVERQDQ